MNNKKGAFTFIELIVTAVILVLISSIGFYSFVGYLSSTRDGYRKADAISMSSALKIHKQTKGTYPLPGDYFSITNNGTTIVYQGKFNKNLKLSKLEELPLDPYSKKYYTYSVKKNRSDFQIGVTLENGDFPIALVEGSYYTISKNVLPSLLLALKSTSNVEIKDGVGNGSTNRNYFILDGGINLAYSLIEPYDPYYGGEDIDTIIDSGAASFSQKSSYLNCIDIGESKDSIGEGVYQILSGTGLLANVTCDLCLTGLIDSRDTCDTTGVGLCGTANGTTISSEPYGAAACNTGNKYNYVLGLNTATWECKGAGVNEGNDDSCSATYTP